MAKWPAEPDGGAVALPSFVELSTEALWATDGFHFLESGQLCFGNSNSGSDREKIETIVQIETKGTRNGSVETQRKRSTRRTGPLRLPATLIPMAISVRHVHLTQETVERLFGAGYLLNVRSPLSQPGQYAAEETVTLSGPRGRLAHVRIVGPPRSEDQVELSRTDEIELGVDAPLRESGDLSDTPGIVIEGPAGSVTLQRGVICALRHIHMSPADADALGLKNHDQVSVAVVGGNRRLTFNDISVRVSPEFTLELHLDSDEGNAAGLPSGAEVLLAEIC